MGEFIISTLEVKGERLFIRGSFSNHNETTLFHTFLKWDPDNEFIIETMNFNSDIKVTKEEFIKQLKESSPEAAAFIRRHRTRALLETKL